MFSTSTKSPRNLWALCAGLTCITAVAMGQQELFVSHEPHGSSNEWIEKYGEQYDQPFSGPLSFAHTPYHKCLQDNTVHFDTAILGLPFDTGVSYRPGARFGPYAIRSGSRRQRGARGYTLSWGMNPYLEGHVVDCGDVPASPFDNALAVDQIEVAYSTLLKRPVPKSASEETEPVTSAGKSLALDGRPHPRIISLGGDHTIVLPVLRALNKVYGPVSVIHFDAHLDTWRDYPIKGNTEQARITHGTFFSLAQEEGLISNNSIHAGIRCKLAGTVDLENDASDGFQYVSGDDIDDLGIPEIIKRIRTRIGSSPVYLSLDIDVIDPGMAPGTGTPEAGGWTTREVKRIIRGLKGLNFVGADVVEVSPSYDTSEVTAIAAADLVHDFLSLFTISNTAAGTQTTRDEL